ncbi:MAG: SDR family oxidoreductase [Micrococcales bacterium]|nr:SDR family oxidoreductase [Micrococcales bacterium]
MDVQGKVFVVTGGGDGMGREVTLGLLARGARVAAVDLRTEALEQTRDLAPDGGAGLSLHTADITDREAVAALPAAVLAEHGQVDGVVNVAGIIQRFVPFVELEFADMEKVIEVNFWGTVAVLKAFLPELTARPEASVVNVASMGGFLPVPGQTVYGASKAAVKLLTEGLYAEMRGSNVHVSLVYPGAINTNITGNSGVSTPGGDRTAEDSKFPMTEPQDAARQIIEDAIIKARYRVLVGKDAAMLDRFVRTAPRQATEFIAKKMASLRE